MDVITTRISNLATLHRIAVLASLTLFGLIQLPVAHAGTPAFTYVQGTAGVNTASATGIQFFTTSAATLELGLALDMTLPSGDDASGVVSRKIGGVSVSSLVSAFEADDTVVVPFANQAGSMEIHTLQDQVVGITLFDPEAKRYYTASLDTAGKGMLEPQSIDKFQCVDMPTDSQPAAAPTAAELADTPNLAALRKLQSRPDAQRTIYIHYFGGVMENTAWTDAFNNGNPITYGPYGGDSSFSADERFTMYIGWLEMAEDYAPFDVNITTSLSVYNATPKARRSRINATLTQDWIVDNLGFSGGVAYLNSFGDPTGYKSTGWTFNDSLGSMGQTHSHEAGHQMNLNHDGDNTEEYNRGHGRWGPIMGGPFGQEYVQWSQGDYPGANNKEDDLSLINLKLPLVADEAGNSVANATPLALPAIDVSGLIAPDGLNADVDVYSFSLSAANTAVVIDVSSETGAQFESSYANAALNATLNDDSGTVIASMTSADVFPLSTFTNKLHFNGPLSAGTYFLTIDAVSPNTDWSGEGFDEYGNGGYYRFSVDADAGSGQCDVLADDMQFTLAANRWEMVTLPCEPPAGETVATIFGDDIDGSYGPSGWIMYAYDPAANTNAGGYRALSETDGLEMGQGYWIMQVGQATALLTMPEGSSVASIDQPASTACDATGGCRSLALSSLPPPLPAPATQARWNLIGNPSPVVSGVLFDDIRVTTDSNVCSAVQGCSITEADAADVVYREFYRYNGSSYSSIGAGGTLDIWSAYWVAELPEAEANGARLVIPASVQLPVP